MLPAERLSLDLPIFGLQKSYEVQGHVRMETGKTQGRQMGQGASTKLVS